MMIGGVFFGLSVETKKLQKQENSKMRKIRACTLMALFALMLMVYALPIGAQTDGLPEYTGGPAEIRFGWWGNDDRAARTQAVIDLFEAAYPDISVVGEPN